MEDVFHTLPSKEVEQTHLLAGTVWTTKKISATSAGQLDELIVAVDETTIDGGNSEGYTARAENVLVVQTTNKDEDLFVGVVAVGLTRNVCAR